MTCEKPPTSYLYFFIIPFLWIFLSLIQESSCLPLEQSQDSCRILLKEPEFEVGSNPVFEAALRCKESYLVEFNISGQLYPSSNYKKTDSGEVRVFQFERSYPINLNDAGKTVQAIAKKYGFPELRSAEKRITVFDRPLVITQRLKDEKAARGQKATKMFYVRLHSSKGLSREDVTIFERRSSTGENSKVANCDVTITTTKVPGIFEVYFEFPAQESGKIHAEVANKFLTAASPYFNLEVSPDTEPHQQSSCTGPIIGCLIGGIAISAAALILIYVIVRQRTNPTLSLSETHGSNAQEIHPESTMLCGDSTNSANGTRRSSVATDSHMQDLRDDDNSSI